MKMERMWMARSTHRSIVADILKEGYDLPPGYEWDEVDVETQEGRDEVFNLLASNYVEDDDEMFQFAYARSLSRGRYSRQGTKRVGM